MDPKVEYKREGMRMFNEMWFSVGERMTDLIFRMEALDEGFIQSTFQETNAQHAAAANVLPTQLAQQQISRIWRRPIKRAVVRKQNKGLSRFEITRKASRTERALPMRKRQEV